MDPAEFIRRELGRIKVWLVAAALLAGFALLTMSQQAVDIRVLRGKVERLERYVSEVKSDLKRMKGEPL